MRLGKFKRKQKEQYIFKDCVNYTLAPIFASLISHKIASLNEIKNNYYLDECLDLLDIIQTDCYNERIINENIQQKMKR